MKRILVVYHSQQHGNTRKMAELVADGCRQVKDVEVQLANVNDGRVTMDDAERADAYALGSPDYFTYMAGGLKQFFDDILLASWQGRKTLAKPYVAFLSHGGGGGALRSIKQLAEATKLLKVADSVTCEGAPQTPADMGRCVRLGRSLAERVART